MKKRYLILVEVIAEFEHPSLPPPQFGDHSFGGRLSVTIRKFIERMPAVHQVSVSNVDGLRQFDEPEMK